MEVKDSEILDDEGNEDFVILEDGDSRKDSYETNRTNVPAALYILTKNDANSASLEMMRKLWAAISTLHLFFLPAILGLMLGHGCTFFDMHEDFASSVMVTLFGVALCFGLPVHLIALGDLEDALYEDEEPKLSFRKCVKMESVGIQTQES